MSFELFVSPNEFVMASVVETDLLEDLRDQSASNLLLAEAMGKALKAEKSHTAALQEDVSFLRQLLLSRPEPRNDNHRTVVCRNWASPAGCSAGDACTFRHDVREKGEYVRE